MRTYLLHPPPNFDTTMALAKDEMLVKEFLEVQEGEKKGNQSKPTGKAKEEEVPRRPAYNRPPPRRSPPSLMRRLLPPPKPFTLLNSPGEEVF